MKIESIRAKLDKLEQGQTIGPFEIDIAYLSQDPTFQVRQKLDAGNVERLKGAYKAGAEVAPVTLAIVAEKPDRLFIVDGHHRITALETIMAEQQRNGTAKPMLVKAKMVKLTAAEARWQAAAANMTHGQRITNKEWRKAFQRYVEAGRHVKPDGDLKSYREIGKEFSKTHPTIRTWMHKDFPQVARQMKDEDAPVRAGGTGIPTPVVPVIHRTRDALREIGAHFDTAYSGERDEIISALWDMLDDFERVRHRTDAFSHDENVRNGSACETEPGADF